MIKKVRGEQRFASITYSLIAEWTGLSLETIKSYGANKQIPKHDLEATMLWVNAKRAKKGRPPIGVPVPELGSATVVEPKTPAKPRKRPGSRTLDTSRAAEATPDHHPTCKCLDCWAKSRAGALQST